MPIQIVDNDRLYRKIARQLSDLMAAGEFVPGQRLPAERELAQQLGVSRPSVREALIALEIEGKVEVRVGSGVFVTAPSTPAPIAAALDEGEGPFELLRARSIVEGETAACAARDAEDADRAEIARTVSELQRRHAAGQGSEAPDRAFHLAIARATHNGPLLACVQMLWDHGRGAMWKLMERHFETPELREATLNDHRAVLDAIEARDPGAARAAMRRHLARVSREFARGWEQKQNEQRPGAAARAPRPRSGAARKVKRP